MKKIIIFLLSSICLFANIGTVVDVVGDATLIRDGKNIQVVKKLGLKEHDFVKTGKNAKVKIFFKDNTAVSLGQNTSFEIDSYLFTEKQDSKINFKVLKGFFKTVTGKIGKVAPNRFKLQTKNSTIGIRGTVFAAEVGDDADIVMCTDGRIMLFTPNGDIEVNSGSSAFVNSTSAPQVKQYSQKEKEQLIKDAGWHGSMSIEELKEFIKKNFKEPLRSQLLSAIENIYDKDSSQSKQTIVKNADDIGFVDEITINNREFDELPREIEFYADDLEDGKVIVQGILESEDKAVHVDTLFVEITTDGGDSWTRAKGNSDWEWSFTPKIEKEYEFSLRVVQDVVGNGSSDFVASEEPEDVSANLADKISIAGFILSLNADVSLRDGKISGSGTIEVPYLDKISALSNNIEVDFSELSVVNNIVTLGDITYANPFVVETPLTSLHVDSIIFSPVAANNKIVGRVNFQDTLGSSFGEIELPPTSKFLPTSFALNIPFESKVIDIWKEKSVAIAISEGSLDIGYTLGNNQPTVDLNIPSAQFKMGELLSYANGVSAEVGLGDFGRMPTVELPNEVFLLDTGIKLPSGLSLSFNLNDYTNPELTFTSSANLDDFNNEFAQNLQNANIDVMVSKTGFTATLTGDGGLEPVTLLNRGSESKSVKLLFDGDNPTFIFGINNGDSPLSFSVSGVTPKLQFGDLFTNEAGEALNKIVSLGEIDAPTLSINEPMYLLGSKIKLPRGFSASVDLADLKSPILDFDIAIDFKEYDNIIAKQIAGANIVGRLSKDGFLATVNSEKPSPITIYEPKEVKIVFKGEQGPSFGINITGTESLPELSISNIDADLDFGTLLTDSQREAQKVIASIGVIREDGLESLALTLPAKVRLLQSKLAFENIVSSLNLVTKNININSTVDLSEYAQNEVLKALSGANFDMSITPESFSGTISVEDELEPINIWAEKKVALQITGKPSIGISVSGNDVDFDFGKLNASLNFGELLTSAKDSADSVIATFEEIVSDAGNYSIKVENDVYLLGSNFILKNPQIDFNPNIKSVSFGSTVDLSNYTEPMVKAFDGATFTALVSSTGFTGSMSKEGGFEPIVVLERGGESKDVSVEFTSSPVVSVQIQNSGIDFGFSGGSAEINFGDLLNKSKTTLTSIGDGLYDWSLAGKNKLIDASKVYVEEIRNAKLDIKDFANPKIFFDASVDLSEYDGIFKNVKNARLKNVIISKAGFSASISAHLGSVDIWKEKRVSMNFLSDPTIDLSIDKSGFGLGFSDLSAELNFGDLLENTKANIGSVLPSGGALLGSYAKKVKTEAKEEAKTVLDSSGYNWNIDRNDIPLFGSKILLSNLGGSIDLSDFSNPSIRFDAIADLRQYGTLFKYVRGAELQNVTISKNGLSGSLATQLNQIPIWREKGVNIVFNESPSFYLKVDSNGLKVGASDIDASVHLGSLLNNSVARLNTLSEDIYGWSIEGRNQLSDSSVFLSNIDGSINFADLQDPKLLMNTAVVTGMDAKFGSVSLRDASISKVGFDGYLSAVMGDMNLYTEGTKKVDLNFAEGETPTLHLKITRSDFIIGLSDLSADIAFTNILNDASLKLTQIDQSCVYNWGLNGSHNFLEDGNGVILVSDVGGQIDLCNWREPIVTFQTVADFTGYNFSDNLNLGIADVTNAEITRSSINWNVTVENARANFTILEMGNGPNDDVRVELRNISGNANNAGASVNGADGTLFFGNLFDGNKQIGLTYQTSEAGLKTYGFSIEEDLIYKKDDNNFVTLRSPNGELVEIARDTYKVVIAGQAIARSSVLNAISIGELTASNLEIRSNGFKGDFTGNFDNLSQNILEGKASITLRSVGLHIDSTLDVPISLRSFDGDLDLQYFFDENVAKAALTFVNDTSSIGWSFPAATILHVNQNFEFKNLRGSLDLGSLDALSIGMNGTFGYKNINQEIALENFTIGSRGIAGTIDWAGSVNIFSKLDLKRVGVTFDGINTSGSLGIRYTDNSFLSTGEPLNLGLSAVINHEGIENFEVDGVLSTINIPNFARFNFQKVSAAPSLNNFWISLDGTVKPQHTVFSSDVALEFRKLKISSTGIEIESMEASAAISGSSADLGALSLSVTELGLGYDGSLFYISAHGGLALDIIGEANAGIKLYSDKHVGVDDIAIKIEQSGLVAEGSIAWYDGHAVYGDGFKATLGLGIAGIFEADGLFRIGQVGRTFYWMANANGGIGGGVPFGPLTLYEVGGGVAYHMIYDSNANDFIPDGRTTSLMLNTTIGTSGGGYLWNGDIKVIAAMTNNTLGQFNLTGESWILANRGAKPSKRKISANMTYSPSMFHATVGADIEYNGITVKGSMDAVFSPAEKHVFIGTDSEYAYAFNVDRDLGHVTVGIFGIEGRGFFMVDTNAIAFGESLYVYKHWSKDWWGPDPSLTFKLTAGAKALLIYNPFQMNIDIFAEVGLRGCYGGCISVGADVLVKVALPNPDYVWGRARVRLFGTSISFSGYIHGEGELQEASPKPDIEIFDRIEVPQSSDGASRIPLIKVYSKFQRSQNMINLGVREVKLLEIPGRKEINLNEYYLEGDWKSFSFMPESKLARNRRYLFTGIMRASYQVDGEFEVKEKVFEEEFRTTSSDRVAFSDLVKSITPTNGDKDVHEDKGVEVKYNRVALNVLGGTSADEVQNYITKLYDADDNEIRGTFSLPNAALISRFNPTKDLRIYRYCKDENGNIRETFVLNGVYLNPFNDYTEDDGNENPPAVASVNPIHGVNQAINVNNVNINPVVNQRRPIADILLSAQQEAAGEANVQVANPRELEIRRVIPLDLRVGNIRLRREAEALGEEVMTTFSQGKSYTYYRASKYKIKVIYVPTQEVAYSSSFNIRYNNVPAESQRKVEEMNGNLEPTLTVRLDMMRLGAGGDFPFGVDENVGAINNMNANPNIGLNLQASNRNNHSMGSSFNDGFNNEVRFAINDNLEAIGVYAGIKTKVFVTWELQKNDGSREDRREELVFTGDSGRKLLPGIVRGYKDATIQYISEIDNSVLVELPMELITGDTFCASCEAQNERERNERLNDIAQRARDVSGGRMGDIAGGFRGEFGGMDGGFSHVGGGFNPMAEGAFESMGIGTIGAGFGVSGMPNAHGVNNFNGVQGVQNFESSAIGR